MIVSRRRVLAGVALSLAAAAAAAVTSPAGTVHGADLRLRHHREISAQGNLGSAGMGTRFTPTRGTEIVNVRLAPIAANEDDARLTASPVMRFDVASGSLRGFGLNIAGFAIFILVSALLFFARLEHVRRRRRRGAQARDSERKRIARDIHDTLLQGVQALLFRLQIWEDDPHITESLRKDISAVSYQTHRIVLEARERILKMRRSDAKLANLVDSLKVISSEAPVDQAPAFELSITGEPKILTVDAEEQLLDIAREAVRNAYRHAGANRVDANLEYRNRSLIMTIADDGRGFDPAVFGTRSGSKHFGLTGMRERARQMRAKFRIHSSFAMGTRIEVIVPARAAFRDAFKWPWQSAVEPIEAAPRESATG